MTEEQLINIEDNTFQKNSEMDDAQKKLALLQTKLNNLNEKLIAFEELQNCLDTHYLSAKQSLDTSVLNIKELDNEKNNIKNLIAETISNSDLLKNEHKSLENEMNEAKIQNTHIKSIHEETNALKQEIDSQILEFKTTEKNLQDKINNITSQLDTLQKLHDELINLKNQAVTSYQHITESTDLIIEWKVRFEALRNETSNTAKDLIEQQKITVTKIEEINNKYEIIQKLYNNLTIDNEDKNGHITTSIMSSINNLHEQIKKQFNDNKNQQNEIENDFISLKKALELKINSLLPSAGAASLAYAYFDAKGRYGSIPYSPDNQNESSFIALSKRIMHFIKNNLSTFFYYTLFIVPLLFISDAFISLYLGKPFIIDMIPINTPVTNSPKDFFFRLLITFPLALISWFGFSSIRMNRRLYGEYDHKQRVMELFHGFKKEIDSEGTTEQKQKLLDIMLKTEEKKPSMKNDESPWEILFSLLRQKNK